jgi:putative transcriptional regulator
MSKSYPIIKNKVKQERVLRKITQAELAKYVGISRQTLNLLEKQEYNPSLYLALKLSRVLHQPIDYLFTI